VIDRTAAAPGLATTQTGSAVWIALIAGLTVIGSFIFACAAPLAAVAALAALKFERGEGLALVVVSWFINQAVGFVLLSYPHTADSYAWGAAIGVAAVLGYLAADAATRFSMPAPLAWIVSFAVAFIVYQIGLYAAGVAFAYEGNAFSADIVTEVLVINTIAYAGFIVLHLASVALTSARPAVASKAVRAPASTAT